VRPRGNDRAPRLFDGDLGLFGLRETWPAQFGPGLLTIRIVPESGNEDVGQGRRA
jgi:hypothetical protein